MKKSLLTALVGLGFSLLSVGAAQAQILLTVDISNPSAVTFTATGAAPAISANVGSYANGIDLLTFFIDDAGISNTFSDPFSTLTTADASTGPALTDAAVDNFSPLSVDLSIFKFNSGAGMTFTKGQPAFLGTLTLNLSAEPIPAGLATGNILAGYSQGGPQVVIGQWEVVPEPSTWALFLGGLGLLAFLRRGLRVA
jgi:PEP-CTERM motif